MRTTNVFFLPFLLAAMPLHAAGAPDTGWQIAKIERVEFPLSDVSTPTPFGTSVVFRNKRRFEIPLYRAEPIASLFGIDRAPYLMVMGADCTECDEGAAIRFYPLRGDVLQKASERYARAGLLYDYEDPKRLLQTTRIFFGRCTNQPSDVVLSFQKYLGTDAKWHVQNTKVEFSSAGETMSPLHATEATLISVRSKVKAKTCTEMPGVKSTSEP